MKNNSKWPTTQGNDCQSAIQKDRKFINWHYDKDIQHHKSCELHETYDTITKIIIFSNYLIKRDHVEEARVILVLKQMKIGVGY